MIEVCTHCFCMINNRRIMCCKCGLFLHKYNKQQLEVDESKRRRKLSTNKRKSYGLPPDASQRYM